MKCLRYVIHYIGTHRLNVLRIVNSYQFLKSMSVFLNDICKRYNYFRYNIRKNNLSFKI